MAESHNRFEGQLADEYKLITLAYPDFENFQRHMIDSLSPFVDASTRLLEIGTGNGFTTRLLSDLSFSELVTIDNDAQMIRQAKENAAAGMFGSRTASIEITEADALAFLRSCDDSSFHCVATAFTLHNMEADYRDEVEREVYRILKSGGIFTNADKYAPDGQERFEALVFQIERFFDAFVEMGKLDLLRKWVTHNVLDQSPRHVMLASTAVDRLQNIGFGDAQIGHRSNMQAVLVARKP
jgi:ubiquinone/menaquinone biosynthesis C-methylase UbiE